MSGGREASVKIAGSRLIRHPHRVYFAILKWNRAQPRHVPLVGAIMAAFAFVVMSRAVAIGALPERTSAAEAPALATPDYSASRA